MANMARKEHAGCYQIGIYSVERVGRFWQAHATGPGTIGNGYIGTFPTLRAAHRQITGEDMRD